jgi:23S rRNA pseudouridine1911/1915/1917 synthase
MPQYFDVCYEDRQLLVVIKRAAVATMGVPVGKPSLLAAVRQYLAGDGPDADCFAAVTGRLDFPVAGLVVVAKDPAVADALRRQQEAGSIRKVYHALVSGQVDPPSGQLTGWLLKSKRHRRVSLVPEGTAGAQFAQLNYRLLDGGAGASKLSIELVTGRKHQARAQLSHFGHPILGDRKYDATEPFPEGIALICKRIGLIHPLAGHQVEWEVDYPESWAEPLTDSDYRSFRTFQ